MSKNAKIALIIVLIIVIGGVATVAMVGIGIQKAVTEKYGEGTYTLTDDVAAYRTNSGLVCTPDDGQKFVVAKGTLTKVDSDYTLNNNPILLKLTVNGNDVRCSHYDYTMVDSISNGSSATFCVCYSVPSETKLSDCSLRYETYSIGVVTMTNSDSASDKYTIVADGRCIYYLTTRDTYDGYKPSTDMMFVIATGTLYNTNCTDSLNTNPFYFDLMIDKSTYECKHYDYTYESVGKGQNSNFDICYEVPVGTNLSDCYLVWDSSSSYLTMDKTA